MYSQEDIERMKRFPDGVLKERVDAKLCREAFVDSYELELRRIEKNSNLEKPVPQPVLPAGITLRKVTPEKNVESDRDITPLPTMFQQVFKRLENFRKNTALRSGAKRLKSIDDDFDSL